MYVSSMCTCIFAYAWYCLSISDATLFSKLYILMSIKRFRKSRTAMPSLNGPT